MPPVTRGGVLLVLATGGLVVFPRAAYAHGIHGGTGSVDGFLGLGFVHMLLGWDHLLFIAGVVLLAGQVKRAAKLISLFALGHSATLIAATLAGWRVNPTAVDMVIALSVVFVGVVGLNGRPKSYGWFAAVVLAFGLVHGLGLATRLQDAGLPADGQLIRVIAFNLGVELGQLVAVVFMFVIGELLRPRLTWPKARQLSHVGLLAAGLVAASALTFTATQTTPAQAIGSCQTRDRTETYPAGGGHPRTDFFEPGQPVPEESFGHVIGDGFVIVHYQPELPADQLGQLRGFVTDPASGRVVGGSAPGQPEVVKAVHAYTTLVCDRFDLAALQQFTADWFDDPRSEPAR